MKKLKLFILIIGVVSISGCLTTRGQLKTETEGKVLKQQVTNLQETKADAEVRFQDMDAQFRDLNGRVEVVEQNIKMEKDAKLADKEGLLKEKQGQEEKFKLYQEALEKVEKQVLALAAEVEALKRSKVVAKKAAAKKKRGNFGQAELDFGKKRWKEAIVGYQKYRELNPKGKKYSTSTYKIGVCFQEMGMKSEAKSFYQEVVDKSPKSRLAKKAQYRLKNIK